MVGGEIGNQLREEGVLKSLEIIIKLLVLGCQGGSVG